MREKNDRDSNLKSFENKNAKALFLNFQNLKFNKFNRNNDIKISHIYKNNENKRKSEIEIEYKIFIYFYYNKKDYIKFNCSNKNKSIIYIIIIIIKKNDSISQLF